MALRNHKIMLSIPNDHFNQVCATELLKNYLDKHPLIKNIVDLGCGTGDLADLVHKYGRNYIGVDIQDSPEVRSRKRTDVNFLTYDGINLPFENDSQQLIFSKQVFEHVRHPFELLADIYRCLQGGGGFLGSVSQLEPYHSYSTFNYTFYGLYCMLSDLNFKVIELRPSIDSIALIQRSINKFLFKTQAACEDMFWSQESPLNYIISTQGKRNNWSNQLINLKKLQYCGQFCFVAKK